ncbi:type II secretion system protein [Ferrimonas sp. SCSIO 43195]|uniref:type II secretion system protein n=1 Tax=Ferrimonas sp. SCSIO 43195 TaxID=2822844 RepID=UPI00273A648E|nr:type II secretion system protein [Ferrimonas sp. SCSIO 43195]
MTNQRGFTLIELVVVIIVLGILAVTAAPKFIDLQTDARIATLKGAKGAIQGANALVYAKAAVNGVEGLDCTDAANAANTGCVAVNSDISIKPVFGSIDASDTDLQAVVELDGGEWDLDDTTTSGTVYITPDGVAVDTASGKPDACQLEYVPATSSVAATYTIEDKGC